MKYIVIKFMGGLVTTCLLFTGQSLCQSEAVIRQGGSGRGSQTACVILKRMGPADEVTSHLYSFGIRGKQFQYVEGKLPDGASFHGRLTDHDVRNLQDRGAQVVVLEPHYTSDDLMQARANCREETSGTPNLAASKAEPSQTLAGDHTSATTVKPTVGKSDLQPPQQGGQANIPASASAAQTTVDFTSVPPGADIELDGVYAGSTPSTEVVTLGEHTIKITKTGYKSWERKMKTTGGHINVAAQLEGDTSPAASTTVPQPSISR